MDSLQKENIRPQRKEFNAQERIVLKAECRFKTPSKAAPYVLNTYVGNSGQTGAKEKQPRELPHNARTPLASIKVGAQQSMAKTPRSVKAASRRSTWSGDLESYVEARIAQETNTTIKEKLLTNSKLIKQNNESAECWWKFLAEEQSQESPTLYKLYEWATKLVPRQGNKNNENYINLWLGYIKRQKNEEDIRDTFKTLRNMSIGERSAILYEQWALFERASGNLEKAKGILKKAKEAGALTKQEIEDFMEAFLVDTQELAMQESMVSQMSLQMKRSNASFQLPEKQKSQVRTAFFVENKANAKQIPMHFNSNIHSSDKSSSDESKTDSSVLAPRTFYSSSYSASSTLNTLGLSDLQENKGATSTFTMSRVGSDFPTNSVTSMENLKYEKSERKSVRTEGVIQTPFATPVQVSKKENTSGTPNETKGLKSLGLKKFAGPARRIKPMVASAQGKQHNEEESRLDKLGNITCTENYTDLSGKLSPIVEASYSSSTSSKQSTKTTSSSQTNDNMASSHSSQMNPNAQEKLSTKADTDKNKVEFNESNAASTILLGSTTMRKQNHHLPSTSLQSKESNHSVTVNGIRYTVLECVGKGGSSKVFKVISPEHKIYALKRIKLQGREEEAATGFMDEITLLSRLKGRHHIIHLVDSEIVHGSGIIYVVLEYGEVDLARLLQKREKARSAEGQNGIDLNFIRLHWQQMLEAVHIIHEERIVHSDLKPANFLFVEGVLKLIDFGIAKAIQNDTTHIARESQVGTLNYMSPEAILSGNGSRSGKQTKVGRASDVWSLGCILYQMVCGHTPFSQLQFIQKLHAITDPNFDISFPAINDPSLEDVLRRCLDRNPKTRVGIPELLDHPFLHPSKESKSAGTNLLTPELLNSMLMQLSISGQSPAYISKISQELCKQLAAGHVPDIQALVSSIPTHSQMDTKVSSVPPPPPPPIPPPPPNPAVKLHEIKARIEQSRSIKGRKSPPNIKKSDIEFQGDIAAAVAAKALERSKQRQEAVLALETKQLCNDDKFKCLLQKQQSLLRCVDGVRVEYGCKDKLAEGSMCENEASKGESAQDPENLAGILRQGLRRFDKALHLDDTMTMTGDITGSATEDTMSWQ